MLTGHADHDNTPRPIRPGFTMVELMVVIAVIAILAGILLVAMAKARERGLYTQTESTMQEFAKACDTFQVDNRRYPGVLSEEVLATGPGNGWISGTENAVLDLMGGYRLRTPYDSDGTLVWEEYEEFGGRTIGYPDQWSLKVDIGRIGEGPEIDGKPRAPYFTPNERQVAPTRGQVVRGAMIEQCVQYGQGNAQCIPDLMDAWGQPIIYLRRARTKGPLFDDGSGAAPQFYAKPAWPYTRTGMLGEFRRPQRGVNAQSIRYGSLLNAANDDLIEAKCFAQIIRNPSLGAADDPLNGTARGAYAMFSAGPDGIYFSVDDGPGDKDSFIGSDIDFEDFFEMGPGIIDEFNDIRVFGGS